MAEVLIVDDQADAREPLGLLLEKAGHAVRFAPDGREALAQVILKLPDVVLLDLMMPTMSGDDFVAVVRSYLRFHGLPIVVLTALSNTPTLDRVRRLGVHSVLLKSKATFDDIRRAVEDAARAQRRSVAPARVAGAVLGIYPRENGRVRSARIDRLHQV